MMLGGGAPAAVQAQVPWPSSPLDGDLRELDSDDNGSECSPFLEAEIPAGLPSHELARRLQDNETKQLQKIEKLRRRKTLLKSRLAAQQMKEKEFISQMDAHMDDIDRVEQELRRRAEQLAAENQRLRSTVDQQARDTAQQVERLAQSTKQCSESEARVQFLVDRIVALLSAAPGADPELTEAVVSVRQKERVLLQQLEEARHQFDEVQRQNGELTSRLTEELGLSRRLSDQLAEVEERFFVVPEQPPSDEWMLSSPGGGQRLGPQPPGFRSDQTETPPELCSLATAGPGANAAANAATAAAAAAAAAAMVRTPAEVDSQLAPAAFAEAEAQDEERRRCQASDDDPAQLERVLLRPPSERGPLVVVPEDILGEEPIPSGAEAAAGEPHPFLDPELEAAAVVSTVVHSGAERCQEMRPLPEAVMIMEQRLREALDDACFCCAVVRVEAGVYNFGPRVRAVVELTPEGEVVAKRDGTSFEPIDDFIRNIPQALVDGEPPVAAADGLEDQGAAPPAAAAAAAAAHAAQAAPAQAAAQAAHPAPQPAVAAAACGWPGPVPPGTAQPPQAASAASVPPAVPASWQLIAGGVLPPGARRAAPARQDPRSLAGLAAAAGQAAVAPSPRLVHATPCAAAALPRAPPMLSQARYLG